jgi:hypothetical protein
MSELENKAEELAGRAKDEAQDVAARTENAARDAAADVRDAAGDGRVWAVVAIVGLAAIVVYGVRRVAARPARHRRIAKSVAKKGSASLAKHGIDALAR